MLDLTKQMEKNKRETIVGEQYRQAVLTINSYMPMEHQIRYVALDYDYFKKYKAKAKLQGEESAGRSAAIKIANGHVGKGQGTPLHLEQRQTFSEYKRSSYARTWVETNANEMHDEGGGEDMGDGDNTLDITNVINATTTSFYNVNDNISTKKVKSTVRRVVGMQENFDERENKEVSPIVTSVGTGIEAALEMRDKESHTFAGSRGVGAVGGTNTALHAGTVVLNDLTPGDVAQGEFSPSGKLQPSAQPSQPPSGGQKTTNNVEMVLDEVTDMAISESGIFCTKVDFIGSVELFREEHVKTSKKRGFMLQQGVLRTNCIDCIDRTNAAQTFMGIKMLNVALKSIGCRNANESALGSEHPLIQGLIAMYVDLGNHLSLQYGGSEAHLKFEGFNSTKSTLDEQFTSLKRYYSNSFEDHIKQHAMNVFLGMYAPMKEGTPLWESTDDYHLHNRRLKPVESYVDRILFEKIIFDVRRMCRLSNKVIGVKQLEDGKGG